MTKIVSRMQQKVLDALFPPRCPFCDKISFAADVCESCRGNLPYVENPFCLICGRQLDENELEFCRDCGKIKHNFISGRVLFVYSDLIRHSIYRFKYEGRQEYARRYAHMMEQRFRDYICQIKPDYLVPIPLHKKRYIMRGYNQAQLLAQYLSKECRIPCRNDLVKRVKNTAWQKDLDARQRQNNLKKAFKITQNDVKLKTIILIDDIYTTGSTVDAVAQELLAHGASKVYFLAVASGR